MRLFFSFLVLCCLLPAAHADSLSVTGHLDPSNPNDIYLSTFVVSSTLTIVIQSYGYGGSAGATGGTNAAGTVIAAGGFDTYFSLFKRTGNTATFYASNDDSGCNPATGVNGYCEDSRLSLKLGPGNYTLVLGLPSDFSVAENYGYGTLGDGFIGLQGDYYDSNSGQIRTSNFAFDISGNGISAGTGAVSSVTPEPSAFTLLATGLAGVLGLQRKRGFKH